MSKYEDPSKEGIVATEVPYTAVYGSVVPQGAPVPDDRQNPQNGPLGLGIGGLPRARPLLTRYGVTDLYTPFTPCGCCNWGTGPNVPMHWWDAGEGWVTRFFTDVEPFDWKKNKPGVHRCQAGGGKCNHEIRVAPGTCATGPCSCCWCPVSAEKEMVAHVQAAHGIQRPVQNKRVWDKEVCELKDCHQASVCCDAYLCPACNGSRQMMALHGHRDTFNFWWAAYFCLVGCRQSGRYTYWIPPHLVVALLVRFRLVSLENIDENVCTSTMHVCCCALCSNVQTYNQLTKAGVWPGSSSCVKPPKEDPWAGAATMV